MYNTNNCRYGGPYSGYVTITEAGVMSETETRYVIVEDTYPYEGGNGYNGDLCKEANIEQGKIYDSLISAGDAMKKIQKISRRISLTIRIYKPK
jgi:hypothetical protein